MDIRKATIDLPVIKKPSNYSIRTYIQEQNYYIPDNLITENMIKKDAFGDIYYFDINTDTSKNSSSEVADAPIDASRGATLQDKRIVNMKTIGISGKFSAKYTNNLSFKVPDYRIGIIVRYFEDAKAKQKIYTVCRKGSMFYNMMLNKVTFKFGEYCSTVEVSLSFIEVNIIELEVKESTKIYTVPDNYEGILSAGGTHLVLVKFPNGTTKEYLKKDIELYPPKIYYKIGSRREVYIGIENPNNMQFKAKAIPRTVIEYDYCDASNQIWYHKIIDRGDDSWLANINNGTLSSGEIVGGYFTGIIRDLNILVKNFKITAKFDDIFSDGRTTDDGLYTANNKIGDYESTYPLFTDTVTNSDGSVTNFMFEYFPSKKVSITISDNELV